MVRPHSSIAAAFPGYGSATPSAEFRSFGIKRPTICMGAHAKQRITLRAAAIHYAADPKKNRTPIVLMSIRLHTSALVTLVATGVGLLLCPRTVTAQKQCNFLCAPSVVIEPSMITNHLFSRPGVRALSTGAVHTLPSTTNLEIVVAASLKTLWPTVSLYGSVQWLPNATAARNPSTLYTASDVDADKIRANAPTASGGVSFTLIQPTETKGLLSINANVGDLFSNAARPNDASAYTHKLDLGLVGTWNVFESLPKHTYAHSLAVVTLLDYVATGLPKAGDEVPKGERVFVNSVHSPSLIIGLSIPLVQP